MKKHKHISPEQIAKIKSLYATGMSSYQIAKAMKLPPHVTKYHTDRVLLERAKRLPAPVQERLVEQDEISAKQKNKLLLDFITTYLTVD